MVNSPPRTSQNLTGLTSRRFPPFVTRPVIRVTRPLTGLTSHAFTDEYIIRFRPNPHDTVQEPAFSTHITCFGSIGVYHRLVRVFVPCTFIL